MNMAEDRGPLWMTEAQFEAAVAERAAPLVEWIEATDWDDVDIPMWLSKAACAALARFRGAGG